MQHATRIIQHATRNTQHEPRNTNHTPQKMTFEEFFKKKRIDLVALQGAEPSLLSEFKLHYAEMGEKSFDHTKKYWFNKLRREFPLAAEVKTEKVKIDNPLAEQTITESLIDLKTAPKLGFVPKFKTAGIPEPTTDASKETSEVTPSAAAIPTAPKPGFTPRFKASNLPKPAAEPTEEPESATTPPTPVIPKPGFTPRFKAANMPKPATESNQDDKAPEDPIETQPDIPANPELKPAYKPRFNMKNIPKKEDE